MVNIFLLNGISNYSFTLYNRKANKRAHIMTFSKENAIIGNGDMDHYMTLHCYHKENGGILRSLFFSLEIKEIEKCN